jgi:hypothetical protein
LFLCKRLDSAIIRGKAFKPLVVEHIEGGFPMKGKLIFCVLSLCILLTKPVWGQVASSTTLVGAVTDASGAVIPNATVVAVQDATKVAFKGVTSGR